MKITIGLVDDHTLFLKSLENLINSLPDLEVIATATSGHLLLQQLAKPSPLPDIIVVDVEMGEMDGPELAQRISERYPLVKLVALTMNDSDTSIIRMLRAGCCAYLLKEIHPDEFERALREVQKDGFYNADGSNIRYRRMLKNAPPGIVLSEKEKQFLQFACSDLTYKQIAGEMNLSERTIDGYREVLFEKFNVQSRVGMALEAIRLRIVKL